MKTYTAEYTTGTKGGRSVQTGWLIELTYDSGTAIYFSSYACNLTGAGQSIGCALSVNGISSSVDISSSEWTHSRVSITLADAKMYGTALAGKTNKTLAGLLVQKQFKGRAVSIWRINSSMTTVTGHDKEFTGFVSDFSQLIDGSTFTFTCDSWAEKPRKEIPQTIINEIDYPLAPKQSFGQRLPIVYGTFEHELDSSTYERDLIINNFNYVPSVCVDASVGKFVFAGHEVNALANTDIAIYDQSLKNYLVGVFASVPAGTTRPTVSTSSPANVLLTSPANMYMWQADAIYLIPDGKGAKDDNKTTSRQYLFNQGLSDGAAILTSTGIDQYCTQRFLSLAGAIEFYNTGLAGANKLWIRVSSTTGSPTYRLLVWNTITGAGDEGLSASGTGWISVDFGTFTDRSESDGTAIASNFKWTIEEIGRYEYGIKIETISDIIEMQALCLEIGKPIITSATYVNAQAITRPNNPIERDPIPDPWGVWTYDRYGYAPRQISNIENINSTISRSAVFAEIKGREFGAWIDEGGRSNAKNSGDLINESSFQIESILRDELGFTTTNIEVADFDDAESGRSNTHFSISQPVDAYKVISELSQATSSVTFPTLRGKWRHIMLPQDPEGDATYDMAVDWKDIAPLDYYTTSLQSLCNKLKVRYHLDYGSGQFTKEYIREDATSQGTTASGYNHIFDRELSIPFFRFDSSSGATNWAEDFADIYVQNWKDPHSIFEFSMLNHSKFTLEDGDVVIFTNFERNIGAIGGSAAGNYWGSILSPGESIYWLIVKSAPQLDSISYTAINLHQLV